MEDERYQKELFEFEKPKKAFPRLGRIFTKTNFALTLTLEKVVFISIGLILLLVIIYALGVERGKAAAPVAQARVAQVVPAHVVRAVPAVAKPLSQEKMVPAPVKKEPIQDTENLYTIVAVTFARKDTALAEVSRLKKEGFDAFVAESEPYFIVCVGSYPNKESGQKTLNKVRRLYKDAYFKLK